MSSARKTSDPAIPPVPPKLIMLPLQKALFHGPRILFAWYTITDAMLALAPAVTRIEPRY